MKKGPQVMSKPRLEQRQWLQSVLLLGLGARNLLLMLTIFQGWMFISKHLSKNHATSLLNGTLMQTQSKIPPHDLLFIYAISRQKTCHNGQIIAKNSCDQIWGDNNAGGWREGEDWLVAKIRICYNQSSCLSSDQPVILAHFLGSGSLFRLEAHHTLEKRLKLLHPQWLLAENAIDLVVEGPEILELSLGDQSVELILRRGQLEGEFSHHQCKQQHSQSKYICHRGIVSLLRGMMAGMDLRSHIPLPSPLELIESNALPLLLKVSSESKVTELDNELLVLEGEEYILKLEVTVGDAQGVQVAQGRQQLHKEGFFECKREGVGGEIGKEGALLGKLEDQYVLRDELFSQCITLKGNLLLISKCFDDVQVLQTLQQLELVPQVRLLLPAGRTHHLQHHPTRRTPVREQLTLAPYRQHHHTVLKHHQLYTNHTHPSISQHNNNTPLFKYHPYMSQFTRLRGRKKAF